jgi:hypothetical protein
LTVVPPNLQALAVQDGIAASRGNIVEPDLVESDTVIVELRFVVDAPVSGGAGLMPTTELKHGIPISDFES